MKRIQALCISLLLVIFLMVTVFMPPVVSRIKDQMLFGKVTTQKLNDTKAFTKSELSIEDKIALIDDYKAGQDNVIMVSQDPQIYDQGEKEDIAGFAMNELEKLKGIGIFPQIKVSETQNIKFAAESYTVIDDPSRNTEIWEIAFSSDKTMITILMDADTHLILQYNVWTMEPQKFTSSKETPDLFAKYLGIKWDTVTLDKKPSTEKYTFKNGASVYQFIQIHEENSYGIQIAPVMD